MRKAALFGILALMLVLASGASAQVVGQVGVRYDWNGPTGVLTIANAEGMPFAAWNGACVQVASGTVEGPMFWLPVPNSGHNNQGIVLYVRVGSAVFQLNEPDFMWE